MKKGLYLSLLGSFALVGSWLWMGNAEESKNYYQPRPVETVTDGAQGYIAKLKEWRANAETGEIEAEDVLRAREDLNRLALAKKSQTEILSWGEMGPNDMGGRTRAILFDKDNPAKMFAASVSGGIFVSNNAGQSWQPANDFLNNLAFVSLAQSSDGSIYAGTGEGMYYFASGTGTGGILGDGIYKSTDGGQTFTQLASTDPATNPNQGWGAVGKLGVDPNNGNRIYAATSNGFKISEDAGQTWTNVFSGSTLCRDFVVTPSGAIWVKNGNRIYKSPNGDIGSYTELTTVSGDIETNIFRTFNRSRIAVSPEDENYAYVIVTDQNRFDRAYQTTDGGQTWRTIGERHELLNPHRTQGTFNNALTVDPLNKERIIVGGVELWEWSERGGWQQIASLSRASSMFYVHADNHELRWHPTNKSQLWIGNDGGLFVTRNSGISFTEMNKGYATIQFYRMDVGLNNELLGGTQDNGTIFVNPNSVLPQSGTRTSGILLPSGVTVDGDGGYAELSHLDPNVHFKAMQYGRLGRSIDGGENFADFYSFRVRGNRFNDFAASFADFVTPFVMHEQLYDPLSGDSIAFVAEDINISLGFGNNQTTFNGQIVKPQSSTMLVADSFRIVAGDQLVVSDASGSLSGDGTGSFDPVTGNFNVTFNRPVVLEIQATVATAYAPGARIQILSETGDLPILDSLPNGLASLDTAMIQDPVATMFAVGLTAYERPGEATNLNGGVWLTRNVNKNLLRTPEWWHIGRLSEEERPVAMNFSHDGDMLLVATNQGRVHRYSNLNAARTFETADIDDQYLFDTVIASQSVIQHRVIYNSNRAVTGLSIDPENSDRIILTLGNYGANDYVYYTTMGTSPNLTSNAFRNITGDLPRLPTYDAVFNYNDPTGGMVVLATDAGVFLTEDVDATSVSWVPQNSGLANVPVFDLHQTRTVRYDLRTNQDFEGEIYAATHGRGIFKTTSTVDYVGLEERDGDFAESAKPALKLFPNPARDYVNIELALTTKTDVRISVRDLSGRLVKMVSADKLPAGTEDFRLNLNGLRPGTYLISVSKGAEVSSAKLLITE